MAVCLAVPVRSSEATEETQRFLDRLQALQELPARVVVERGQRHQQVDALVDLLMNYDQYAKERSLISPLVQESPPAEPEATTAAGAEAGG